MRTSSPKGSMISNGRQQEHQRTGRPNYFGKRESNLRADHAQTSGQQKARNYFASRQNRDVQSQNGLPPTSHARKNADRKMAVGAAAAAHAVRPQHNQHTGQEKIKKQGVVGGTVPQAISQDRWKNSQHDMARAGTPSNVLNNLNKFSSDNKRNNGSPQSVDEPRQGSHFGSYARNGYESEHVAKVLNSKMASNNQTSQNKQTTLDHRNQAGTGDDASESSGRVASESETQSIESSAAEYIVGQQLLVHRHNVRDQQKKEQSKQNKQTSKRRQQATDQDLVERRLSSGGASADVAEVGQEGDVIDASDEAHSQKARHLERKMFSEMAGTAFSMHSLPMNKPRPNDLALKNLSSPFDGRKHANFRPSIGDAANSENIGKDIHLLKPDLFKTFQAEPKPPVIETNVAVGSNRSQHPIPKQMNTFAIIPSSDEQRRREVGTGDFNRNTDGTAKTRSSREFELKKDTIPEEETQFRADELYPVREMNQQDEDIGQIEEKSRPQLVAASLQRGKPSSDEGSTKGLSKMTLPPTMQIETSRARRDRARGHGKVNKEDDLKLHMLSYLHNAKAIDEQTANVHSIAEAKQRMATQRKKCYKYNYSLDDDIQNFPAFESYFCLKGVGEEHEADNLELEIWNRKPIDNPKYVLEADPKRVLAMREQFEKDLVVDADSNVADENFIEGVHFRYKKSSASCRLGDIKGIIYGGLSTRFWLCRKHMNSDYAYMAKNKRPAFYSWECITLLLPNREIDIVVTKEEDMDDLLEVLIDSLNTVDGGRGSAEIIKAAIQKQKLEDEAERMAGRGSKKARARGESLSKYAVTRQERQAIHKTTLKKYKVLRVRSKISFMAFKAKKTVNELLLGQILKSFSILTRSKEIPSTCEYESFRHNDFLFMKMMKTGLGNIFKTIIQLNAEVLRDHAPKLYYKIKFDEAVDAVKDIKEDSFVEVKDKYGMRSTKEVNYGDNIVKAAQLHGFLSAERAADMFNNVQTGPGGPPAAQDHLLVRYNKTKERLTNLHNKCKLLINMKAIRDLLFIKCALMKTQLAKELFVLEIEQSRESYIPNELAQDHLPMNFWYYDAILMFVQDLVSQETKDLHTFKNTFRLHFYQEENFQTKVSQALGLSSTDGKLTFKHQIVNEIASNVFTHSKSHHSKALQRSRYVMIDDDVARLQAHYEQTTINLREELQRLQVVSGGHNEIQQLQKKMRANARNLILRYCCPNEINKMRQKLLIIKSSFLGKLQYLKALGRKNELMIKAESWIDRNLEELYENYMASLKSRKVKKRTLSYRETLFKDEIEAEKSFQIKRQLKTKMLEKLETLLKQRVQKSRLRSIQLIKYKSRPSEEYQSKVRFIETSIEKDIRYLYKADKSNKIMSTLNNQQIKHQLNNIQDESLDKSGAYVDLDHTRSTVDYPQRSKHVQKVIDNTTIDRARPESFFEHFKTEKVKSLKERILKNQDYLKHTVRIIRKDQEKYMQLLGFTANGKKDLAAISNIQAKPLERSAILDDEEMKEEDLKEDEEQIERLAAQADLQDREEEKKLMNEVIQQTFKDETVTSPAEGGEPSGINEMLMIDEDHDESVVTDDDFDSDIDESVQDINLNSLHKGPLNAPSKHPRSRGKYQINTVNIHHFKTSENDRSSAIDTFRRSVPKLSVMNNLYQPRKDTFNKRYNTQDNLQYQLRLAREDSFQGPSTLNDIDLDLSQIYPDRLAQTGSFQSVKEVGTRSVFTGSRLRDMNEKQLGALRDRIQRSSDGN